MAALFIGRFGTGFEYEASEQLGPLRKLTGGHNERKMLNEMLRRADQVLVSFCPQPAGAVLVLVTFVPAGDEMTLVMDGSGQVVGLVLKLRASEARLGR